jgi:hypothetical protein
MKICPAENNESAKDNDEKKSVEIGVDNNFDDGGFIREYYLEN